MGFPWFAPRPFTLRSKLDPSTCAAKLREEVAGVGVIPYTSKPLWGRVDDTGFEVRANRWGTRWGCGARATWKATDGGTRIEGVYAGSAGDRWSNLVAAVVILSGAAYGVAMGVVTPTLLAAAIVAVAWGAWLSVRNYSRDYGRIMTVLMLALDAEGTP